ncbi:phage tail protein [Orbus mooreae]|uniref:phage tail protein n=1 Tax=Orbus mooreae TaxID=3074107 RepID=UPI00370D0ED8
MSNVLTGLIGCFGGVIFTVSDQYIKTFQDLSVTRKNKYADHEIAMNKPITEFTGEELNEVRFKMRLTTHSKASPLIDLGILKSIMNRKVAQRLIIGLSNLGKYTLRELSDEWLHIAGNGVPLIIDVELVLVEYIDQVSNQAMNSLRTDELMKTETGKGGPERLPGSFEKIKDRVLTKFDDVIGGDYGE